jgi:signal transduction histidine kinase
MQETLGTRQRRVLSVRTSLRARVAFGVGLPVLILLGVFALYGYSRDRQVMEEQFRLTSSQLGQLTLGGLQHAMLENDQHRVAQIIQDVAATENVERIQIVDSGGEVQVDSLNQDLGLVYQTGSLGCVECHATAAEKRPQAIRLDASSDSMRISTPIPNATACRECHTEEATHLGMVILDVSLLHAEEQLLRSLRFDIAIAVITALIVSGAVFMLVHFVIVRRVEALQIPFGAFAGGNLSTRIPPEKIAGDEIGQLAQTFNWMAEEIEEKERERKSREELRERTIREERERISRELHDGLAQLLGYVNAKVMAIRLMLKKDETAKAQSHLMQLEEAARQTLVDVREAILGLRMNAQHEEGFGAAIEEYCKQFSKLSDLPVKVNIDETLVGAQFGTEVELQLMRIVQEALSNIRKHASAKHATISFLTTPEGVLLEVGDDGVGFDPLNNHDENHGHYGLSTMSERAQTIGAEFEIFSTPGSGTRIEILIRDGIG